MDALSAVVRSLRLQGSIYALWHFGAPWGMSFVPGNYSPFHFVQSGTCLLIRKDGQRVGLQAGDVVALFDGAEHRLCDSAQSRVEPLEQVLVRQHEGAWPRRHGGAGSGCAVICGKFAVDENESAPTTLRHLPPLVHIRHEDSARVRPFAATLELLAGEVRNPVSGSEHAASLLTEMLLIQVLRIALAGPEGSAKVGWVAGLRDPRIGSTLAAIHGEPERPWSVDLLAARAGLSRSAFAERFAQKLGRTPMSYLAQWRLQSAGRLLRDTELSISEIQQRLGYGSAASFDRAFKRAHHVSPSDYRKRFLASAAVPSVVRGEAVARRRSG